MPATMEQKRLVDVHALAEITGVSYRQLQEWYRKDNMPCIRAGKRLVRFDPDRVLAWIEKKYGQNCE